MQSILMCELSYQPIFSDEKDGEVVEMQERKLYSWSPPNVSDVTLQNGAVCYRSWSNTKTHVVLHTFKVHVKNWRVYLSSTAVGKCKNIIFKKHIYILTLI